MPLGILAGLYPLFALQDNTSESMIERFGNDHSLERIVELTHHSKLQDVKADLNSHPHEFTIQFMAVTTNMIYGAVRIGGMPCPPGAGLRPDGM